jgi:hypothetical protein
MAKAKKMYPVRRKLPASPRRAPKASDEPVFSLSPRPALRPKMPVPGPVACPSDEELEREAAADAAFRKALEEN